MDSGIYAYWDNVNKYYVYVGKDNRINAKDNRNYRHMLPSQYDAQQINRVLQNNPERYEYRIIMKGNYNEWELNQMEKLCIKSFKTFKKDYPERNVFNFTNGGDGMSGYKPSKETRKKISEAQIGKTLSEETKKKISESLTGRTFTEETKKKMSKNNAKYWEGKTLSEEHKKKISENSAKYWEGKNLPEETKKKISESKTGITLSKEHRKKISKGQSKYKIWDSSTIHYDKREMFKKNKDNKPRKVFRLRLNARDIPIGGFIDFTTPEIIHNLICEAIEDYNE